MIDYVQFKKNGMFLNNVTALKKAADENGNRKYTEKEVAGLIGRTTVGLRKHISTANEENREFLRNVALYLKEGGKTVSEIAAIMGKNESVIRLLLGEEVAKKMELPEIKMAVQIGE